MSRAATPFYCPFCGDEALRPGEEHGTWTCEACTRGFALRSVRPGSSAGTTGSSAGTVPTTEAAR